MKQIMESKILLGFIVMVLGATYINSTSVTKLEDANSNLDYENVIAMNIN